MKKIMFNDKYGLTKAVLEGRKTMTRRIISNDWLVCHDDKGNVKIEYKKLNGSGYFLAYVGKDDDFPEVLEPLYQIGEKVAIAQAYRDIPWEYRHWKERGINLNLQKDGTLKGIVELAGWDNKMFVRADAMPYHIRIKDIKIERLQDISDVDAIKEGIYDANDFMNPGAYTYFGSTNTYKTPREAFSVLIDRISGKGTWERNPWVYAYSFKLID